MSDNESRLREALAKIAEVAKMAVDGDEYPATNDDNGDKPKGRPGKVGCTLRSLPSRLVTKAAETAVKINPVNAPAIGYGPAAALAADVVLDPQRIAILTSKYWGSTPRRLTVSFMEATPSDLRARIVSHLNAWSRTASIQFVETGGTGAVRISRGPGGYWSYLGTDILHIPQNRPTMNLQGFTMGVSEGEFRRVVRHEAGHTLGFLHEHMRRELVARIDPMKAYAYFLRTQGWNRQMVDQQVLTPLDQQTILGTPPDQTSIMCYQLPGSITRDGRPILGGNDINATDAAFAGQIYPRPGLALTDEGDAYPEDLHEAAEQHYQEPYGDWGEDEDVEAAV
jgi:hypothetical protein